MNVGIVADFYFPWVAGPATAIRNLAHGLSERGHRVSLLVPSPEGRASVDHEGAIEVTRVPTVPVPFGYHLRAALPPRGVKAWLRRVGPDVVHVHHPFPLSTATVIAARKMGIPVVAVNHTIPACALWGIRHVPVVYPTAHFALGKWIVALLDRCDAVSTPTDTAAAALRGLGFSRPIEAISNGIDVHRFRPGGQNLALKRRLGLDDRPVVLYTGRLDAEKDMDTWLRAAHEVSRSIATQLVVGGEGADRARLERLAVTLGIHDRTRFIGYVSEDELPDLYRLADAYMITSPVELQSISTLEAIATGLPVVAVDAGALPELVHPGSNGYLVTEGDWEGAARALKGILGDVQRKQEMSARSRDVASSHALTRTIEAHERLLMATAARSPGDQSVGRFSAAGR